MSRTISGVAGAAGKIGSKGASQRDGARRLPGWPASGAVVRVPPRRLESDPGAGPPSYGYLIYERYRVSAAGESTLRDLSASLRQRPIVLVLAAEDVLLTEAKVPPLSASRSRDALPNLIEDRVLTDVGVLHVAQLGSGVGDGGDEKSRQPLGAVDRGWLASVLARLAGAGLRVRLVLPESLCCPFAAGTWSLACAPAAGANGPRMWLRTGRFTAYPLPSDFDSAVSVLEVLAASAASSATAAATSQAAQVLPAALNVYAPDEYLPEVRRLAETLPGARPAALWEASSKASSQTLDQAPSDKTLEIHALEGDPLRLCLEGIDASADSTVADSVAEAVTPPRSLLQHEFAGTRFGAGALAQWKRAAILTAAIVAIECVALQVQWSQLKAERAHLRAQSESALKSAFPATTTILDAPLQMARGLADLRAQAGQNDPTDFTALVSASGKIFADAPVNAFRGFEYGAEGSPQALKIRLAPGVAAGAEERATLTQRAAAASYELRFESSGGSSDSAGQSRNKSGTETVAILRAKSR